MKKITALFLAALMMFSLAACGKKDMADSEYVKENGKLVIGITDYAPMDYMDENLNWVGFDADMAKAFADSLGVQAEFVLISWGQKIEEVKGMTIDCVWNGMTLTDEVMAGMDCSNPYCNNTQVVVIPASKANTIKSVDDLKGLSIAVEDGSSGEAAVNALNLNAVEVEDQAAALLEVKSGTSDAAVIDVLMAAVAIGEGTDYAELTTGLSLNTDENFGVGFRQGSDLVEKLNKFFKDAYADGTMTKLAKQYGIEDAIIEQK